MKKANIKPLFKTAIGSTFWAYTQIVIMGAITCLAIIAILGLVSKLSITTS